MKNKISKLLSVMLLLAMLVSCTSVFAAAETSADEGINNDTEAEEVDISGATVVYNRDYADGWGIYNGVGDEESFTKGHRFYIDYETTVDYSYNYFARFEAADTYVDKSDGTDGFMQLSFQDLNYPKKDCVFVEFDLKTDDVCNLGTILYTRAEGAAANGVNTTLLGIYNNNLQLLNSSAASLPIGNDWVHVVVKFDYTDEEMVENDQFIIEITASNGEDTVTESKVITALKNGYLGLDFLRFGLTSAPNKSTSTERAGQSWCLDNLQAYCGVTGRMTDEQIDSFGYGVCVKTEQLKTEKIEGVDGEKPLAQYLDESLCMKLGVNYALLNGEQVNIYDGTYGAPVRYNGTIVVPLEKVLEYVGYEYYVHEDGKSYDISTGTSSSYITTGRDIATVNGKPVYLTMAPGYYTDPNTGNKYAVVALDDVETLLPGYYVTYDDMGLIIICQKDEIINRDDHLETMLSLMKCFVYHFASAEEIYEDVRSNTNNFTHPYLLGDQSVFDRMIAIWDGTDTTEYDVDLKNAVTQQVEWAYKLYSYFAIPVSYSKTIYYDASENIMYTETNGVWYDADGNELDATEVILFGDDGEPLYEDTTVIDAVFGDEYLGIDREQEFAEILNYPHVATNGYDPDGGRQGESTTALGYAQDIALGYAITGDLRLAALTYDILVALGEWNHWAPGHFLNVADASQRYALALDWAYNGIVALSTGDTNGDGVADREPDGKYDVSYVESLLYKNGVHMGYLSSTKQYHGWDRPQGDTYYYSTMENNWNAVCTSGMWLASLVLLGNENYADEASQLISMNIETLMLNGMDEYAPDGSYVESASYWGYGMNAFLLGVMAIWASTGGKDYGMLDAPGIDTTCYFACFIESSDYRMFNYHDASEGQTVDSCSFYFMAVALDDPTLAEIRKLHNKNGKGYSFRDLFFYPYDSEDSGVEVELPLDYCMKGIDAFTTRSSWEEGALFAGIIAGENSVSHGHIDSGTFVYHNAGVIWITDLGGDDYNVYKYFETPTRYRYYRTNAEGHNVLTLTSKPVDVPFGQKLNSSGKITNWYSNEYGSYAIVDNTDVYGGYAMMAKRGMLLTNNRKTLVIQDEVNFNGVETVYWLAQINVSEINYEISTNGRTLYLYTKNARGQIDKQVRLTILSNGSDERFTVTTCGETEEDRLLKGNQGTVDANFSHDNGSNVSEKSRSDYRRIAIKMNTYSVNLAVVIEMIDSRDDEVGYSFMPMNNWVPEEHAGGANVDTDVERRPLASTFAMLNSIKRSEVYRDSGRHFDSKIEEYYVELSNAWYHYYRFYADELAPYQSEVDAFLALKEEYDAYMNVVNTNVGSERSLIRGLMGLS